MENSAEVESDAREKGFGRVDPGRAASDPAYCHAAIVPLEDMESFQQQGVFRGYISVGTRVAAETLGIPLSRHSDRSTTHVDHLLEYLGALEARGEFLKELFGSRPQSQCALHRAGTADSGLAIVQMGSIWLVSFGFSFIALVVFSGAVLFPQKEPRQTTGV